MARTALDRVQAVVRVIEKNKDTASAQVRTREHKFIFSLCTAYNLTLRSPAAVILRVVVLFRSGSLPCSTGTLGQCGIHSCDFGHSCQDDPNANPPGCACKPSHSTQKYVCVPFLTPIRRPHSDRSPLTFSSTLTPTLALLNPLPHSPHPSPYSQPVSPLPSP